MAGLLTSALAKNLVQYSSSSSDEGEGSGDDATATCISEESSLKRGATREDDHSRKKKKIEERLPLPEGVLSMFSSTSEVHDYEDEADQHDGRIRSFAHERGNWASYVYVQVVASDLMQELAGLLAPVLATCADFKPLFEFHLSLSRTFIARHHCIDPLAQSLRDKLTGLRCTTIQLSELGYYCNDEKTRTFVGVKVQMGDSRLKEYVSQIDTALEEFSLPVYYKNPSFHVSVLWALGDVKDKIVTSTKKQLQGILEDFSSSEEGFSNVAVRELKFKTGNKVFTFPLVAS